MLIKREITAKSSKYLQDVDISDKMYKLGISETLVFSIKCNLDATPMCLHINVRVRPLKLR